MVFCLYLMVLVIRIHILDVHVYTISFQMTQVELIDDVHFTELQCYDVEYIISTTVH